MKTNLWNGFRVGEESEVGAQIIGTFIDAYEANALAEAKDKARETGCTESQILESCAHRIGPFLILREARLLRKGGA